MEEGIQIACKYFTEKVWKSADFGVWESWNQAPMETKEWLYLELGEHACVTLVTVWRITTSCNNAGYMKWGMRSRCGELSFRWHKDETEHMNIPEDRERWAEGIEAGNIPSRHLSRSAWQDGDQDPDDRWAGRKCRGNSSGSRHPHPLRDHFWETKKFSVQDTDILMLFCRKVKKHSPFHAKNGL